MWSWYVCVAISSIIDSIAGVPFTKQWTVRVSRAPKIEVSDDAPWVIPDPEHPAATTPRRTSYKNPSVSEDPVLETSEGFELQPNRHTSNFGGSFNGYSNPRYTSVSQQYRQPFIPRGSIIEGLQKGYNTTGRIVLQSNKGWSAANDAFYVIIGVRGVSNAHAILRIFSKVLSIGVYTVGTAMFASSTLTTILVAVVVASMVISSGVFGRVTAMWMTSELMRDRPLLNALAKDNREAEMYIEAMLRQPDMVFEILDHVIIDGRCVKRLNWFRWSKVFGVMAPPFDITKLVVPGVFHGV
jgi:hypothetical protein